VLLILAGVTIISINGNNGILSKSKLARNKYQNSANEENKKINSYENEIDSYVVGTRNSSYNIPFIDVTNLIDTIASDKDWTTTSCSYTAKQDCYILGEVAGLYYGGVSIFLNDVQIGFFQGYSSTHIPINYLLKKGDKIDFKNNGQGSNCKKLKAFGIKF